MLEKFQLYAHGLTKKSYDPDFIVQQPKENLLAFRWKRQD
jgi:hypothetical protein